MIWDNHCEVFHNSKSNQTSYPKKPETGYSFFLKKTHNLYASQWNLRKENNFKTVRGKYINYREIVSKLTADILAATRKNKANSRMILFNVLQ